MTHTRTYRNAPILRATHQSISQRQATTPNCLGCQSSFGCQHRRSPHGSSRTVRPCPECARFASLEHISGACRSFEPGFDEFCCTSRCQPQHRSEAAQRQDEPWPDRRLSLMARSNSPTLGHPKFPQAGPPDYDDSGATAMRAAASLRR